MAQLLKDQLIKNLSKPDEVRTIPKGKVEIFNLGDTVVGRVTFEPGWTWKESLGPIAKTETCQETHCGYVLSGSVHSKLSDGQELDLKEGDFYYLPAGHDGKVTSDKAFVAIDFIGMKEYGKQKMSSEGRLGRRHRSTASGRTKGLS